MLETPALVRLRQEDFSELVASLDSIIFHYFKKIRK